MLDGTGRDVLELLLERPRSPTEVAEELGVSVQTASRHLRGLVEQGFAEETRRTEGRGYKRYEAREFARVFAAFDGELFEKTLSLSPTERAVLSTLRVPQPEFRPALLTYLFSADPDRIDLDVQAIAVYGSVARGEAQQDSDIDIFVVYDDRRDPGEYLVGTTFSTSGPTVAPENKRVISETWYTVSEFRDALAAGSQFLRNVLDEGIVLYDPEEVIRDARQERTGERVSR